MSDDRYELYYIPVSLSKFRPYTFIDFDLFMKVRNKLVLYRNKNLTITGDDIEKLKSNKVETLYIKKTDRKKYREYVEKNLEKIIKDPNIDTKVKASYLYESAVNVVEDVFNHPRSGETIKRSKKIVNHTVDFILSGPDAFVNLLQIRAHDYYTFTHSVNVCTFAVALANKLGNFDEKTLRELGVGGLLHDLGKAIIDPKIINKPGKLDPMEWKEMQKHPEYGVKIAKESKLVSEQSLLIIAQHHEKFDGTGYPKSLSGKEISLFGRIGTIVDIFDAITTNRSYSKARPPIDAAKFLLEHKEWFDEKLLKDFIQLITVK
jgi:putative nucleotidyltransferase with HDIG domain